MDKEKKLTIGFFFVTIAIIIGGALLLTKPSKNEPSKEVSGELLVRENSQKITAPNEKLVLVEFGDFQCPACSIYNEFIKQVLDEKKETLSFVFRNFPLSQHKNARISSYAAEASGMQGKYWEMYNKMYETQDLWSDSEDAMSIFVDFAKEIGLDQDKFKQDISLTEIKEKVDRDYADGITLRIDSTPTFYLNGQKMKNFGSVDELKKMIQEVENRESADTTSTQ